MPNMTRHASRLRPVLKFRAAGRQLVAFKRASQPGLHRVRSAEAVCGATGQPDTKIAENPDPTSR